MSIAILQAAGRRLLCLMLAAATTSTAAQTPEPAWTVPAGSGWQRVHYDPSNGLIVFSSRQTLSGTLKLEWETREEEMFTNLVFRPDAASRRRMPFVANAYNQNPMDILLNQVNLQANDNPPPAATPPRQLLARYFAGVPASVLQRPEGRISRPATITVSRFGMSVECDRRYYYADTVAIRPTARSHILSAGEDGC